MDKRYLVTKLILNTRNDVVLERILVPAIVMRGELYAVVYTSEDRMTRFGTRVIKQYCQTFNTKLIAIHQPLNQQKNNF